MKDLFTNIYNNNMWGNSESVSGPGSSLTQTKTLIQELPGLIKQLQIKKMLDAPCGDFNWMKEIYKNTESYIGIDIVDEIIKGNKKKYPFNNVQFFHMDITKDRLPTSDLILCRDCLVHFSISDIHLALNNFKASQSRYLLTTTFTNHTCNNEIRTGSWRPLNLEIEPFNFPKPILVINENCTEGEMKFTDKSLALWDLNNINF
ncbi:class I SAM-dependent methyltransferase [Peribacillus simplex]|uniref:class I SAM-dependent methyltransferase n=1 Tax=Peribacillus simplex TaxID=1478 RepID=UPI002853377A|nr:class I SAM-dependent methyltransferase [Peribacillus simplex]MDR4926190.1 class I SAM-dependent methyltransferase [Peribacillus simplex]